MAKNTEEYAGLCKPVSGTETQSMDFGLLGTKRVFDDKSQAFTNPDMPHKYAELRVRYSDELFQVVADYCRETLGDLNLALDVGCGPGNSTLGLTKHFKRVIGTDISPAQIAAAPKDIPNCEFKVANSHQHSFIETGSVDLFSCGEALHYMDVSKTFQEADRLLRPGGTLAVFGYREPKSPSPRMNKYLTELYNLFLPYWDPCLLMLFHEFRSVALPYPGWKRREGIRVRYTTTPKGFLDMIKSLSIYPAISRDNPKFSDQVEGGLAQAIREDSCDTESMEFEYYHDITLLLGHKPLIYS